MVCGVGINDANYAVAPRINGKAVLCPSYKAWASMLSRCYSEKYLRKNNTYTGVTVCKEWHSFMSFREWWLENHVDGWQLDKDILSDNREYSPENCLYVPGWINSFLVDCGASRGDYPIGVHFVNDMGRFRAECCNAITGRSEHLGYFSSDVEANEAWRKRKLEIAFMRKTDMDMVDERIYNRIIFYIMTMS